MMRAISTGLMLVVLGMGAACGSSDKSGETLSGDHVTVVGPTGLTLTPPGGSSAKLSIPQGALTKATSIGFRTVGSDDLPKLPAGLSAVSDIFEFTPHGLELEKSVKMTLPHRAPSTDGLKVLRLANAASSGWSSVTDGVTLGPDSVELSVDHFSFYVVAEIGSPSGGTGGTAATGGSTTTGGSMGSGGTMTTDGGMDGSGGATSMMDGSVAATGGSQAMLDGGMGDAGTEPMSITYAERFKARLSTCGLVAADGALRAYEPTPFDGVQSCVYDCELAASCSELGAALCGVDQGSLIATCQAACNTGFVVCSATGGQGARCDAVDDCGDGTDEANCPASLFYTCSDGTQFPAAYQCDGVPDCGNDEDESSCPQGTQLVCSDGQVHPTYARCDGSRDCSDGADEMNCASVTFTCGSGEVISTDNVCDVDLHCSDGSDELQGCLQLDCSSFAS